ncbi:MAG TPA: hypothetical protein VE548_02255 [Nitrososphaeraceae archaeon]|jgi:hypothetical protein|nr:hypothetical protein [Nitrososphaeraceae archaeon]
MDVFEELLIADNKILKELHSGGKDRHKILDNFAKRVTLYKECADKQDDPIIKAIIDAKKSVIMSDMGLLSTQYEIQSDIAKVTSRIDALEGKISRNQDRKSSK